MKRIHKIYRILDTDIPEEGYPDQNALRKYFYRGEKVKYVQVRKFEGGKFIVDICYEDVQQPAKAERKT